MIAGVAEALRSSADWRRAAAAFAFGFIGALAYPPTNFFPVLWISFPALIFLLQGAPNKRAAFVTVWSFAFGTFLLGFYWIAAAMFVDIKQFWWGVPLAVAGLPAYFAIYYAIPLTLAWRIGLKGIAGAINFALWWFLADYVRGHLFTGFPWNFESIAWTGVLPVLQITSVIGSYGLTLLTLVAACLPACLAERGKHQRWIVAVSLAMFVFIAAWGMWRLSGDTVVPATAATPHIRIVQPNTDQAHKWLPEDREKNFNQLLDMTSAPSEKPVTVIIWPETASTFYLAEDAAHRWMIAGKMRDNQSVITGVIRREVGDKGHVRYYNSLVAVDHRADVTAVYDKAHLVPFGEYIPVRSFLPMRTLAVLGVDFARGPGRVTLRIPGLPSFSPLICYEAIFSGEVANEGDRPHFLLNVTNDGWYLRTAGPYQHFAIARVRAVEEGLPLVRAANTGISGVVDAYGHILARLGLGQTGFIDADLPPEIAPTFFSRFGEIPVWVMFAVLAGCMLIQKITSFRGTPKA